MYELLVIISGDVTEAEMAAKIAEVQNKLTAAGALVEETIALGKHKIAYPIRHIRQGYFFALYLTTPGEKLGALRFELERHMGLLRVFVRQFIPGKDKKAHKETFTTEVSLRREHALMMAAAGQHRAPIVVAAKTETATAEPLMIIEEEMEKEAAPVAAAKEEKKSGPIDLEAIDKKLDEILGSDIIEGV